MLARLASRVCFHLLTLEFVWKAKAWEETRGMELARLNKISEDALADEKVNATIAAGPHRISQCVRYLLITTQRAGGTWLMDELPRAMPDNFHSGLDAFNFRDGQPGSQMMRIAGFVSAYQNEAVRHNALTRLGPRIWAENVWAIVENGTHKKDKTGLRQLKPPACAVGFKVMGPEVDTFTFAEIQDLLKDPDVKKIVLERKSSYDQWLSRQWTCMLPYSPKRRSDRDFDWRQWTEDRIANGFPCKCGHASELNQFETFKQRIYGDWRNVLVESQQEWLEIKTEQLPSELANSSILNCVSDFLLRNASRTNASVSKVNAKPVKHGKACAVPLRPPQKPHGLAAKKTDAIKHATSKAAPIKQHHQVKHVKPKQEPSKRVQVNESVDALSVNKSVAAVSGSNEAPQAGPLQKLTQVVGSKMQVVGSKMQAAASALNVAGQRFKDAATKSSEVQKAKTAIEKMTSFLRH